MTIILWFYNGGIIKMSLQRIMVNCSRCSRLHSEIAKLELFRDIDLKGTKFHMDFDPMIYNLKSQAHEARDKVLVILQDHAENGTTQEYRDGCRESLTACMKCKGNGAVYLRYADEFEESD